MMDFYAVGTTWGDEEKLESFLANKIWEDGWALNNDDRNAGILQSVKIGDVFVAKSSATKGENHSVTFTKIKAIGIVKNITKRNVKYEIEWLELDSLPVDIAGVSYRKTVEKIRNDKLLSFAKSILQNKQKEQQMQNYTKLLQTNHNLILTGAPGTGKTHLAKEIAKEILASSNENTYSPIEILKTIIENYKIDFTARNHHYNKFSEFSNTFPINNLNELNLDTYCIGHGEHSFCWWIERGLRDQGIFAPSARGAYVYGIYWSAKDNMYNSVDSLHGNDTEKLKTVINSINNCIINRHDIEYLNNEYNKKYCEAGFIIKILNSYFPDEFLQINSLGHINNIIKMFDIPCADKSNPFCLYKSVFDFYKQIVGNNDIKPVEFMSILYNNFNIKDGEVIVDSKSNKINLDGNFKLVQFHPSYDYTDFVEGLRPDPDNSGSKDISFIRMDGVFKKFCKLAVQNPNKKYIFIIDEINRGEISKIFGELFFSIDPGYRGIDENGKPKGLVQTQYQNLVKIDDEFYDGFFVPENVYIIGTMNDIDRSVESMDFAFRRRFVFKEVSAEESAENMGITSPAMKRINDEIAKPENELGKDYQLGGAYFLDDMSDQERWDLKISGLIKEYLRGIDIDGKKFEAIKSAYFGKNQITETQDDENQVEKPE